MRTLSLILILQVCYLCVQAQLPQTNIFSFSYELIGDNITLSNGKMLTSFNERGYNNQPSFVNGEIYLTSNRNGNQTDIVALNPSRKTLYNVTHTAESEYSPNIIPDDDHFSVVRVEQDGKTQTLWKYPLDRSNEGSKVLDDITNVGYYKWINSYLVAMFLVGEPHTLVVRNIFSGYNKVIGTDVGRSIHSKNGNIIYVEKQAGKPSQIKVYNQELEQNTTLIQTLPKSEDFTMLRDGTLLMASKSVLYKFNGRVDSNWVKVVDLRKHGIKNITRLNANLNTILLVSSN